MSDLLKKLRSPEFSIYSFYSLGFLVLLGMAIAIWAKVYYLALFIPGIIALALLSLKIDWLHYTFIAVLPFTIEYEIGSFGLDFPSEIFLLTLAVLSTFWMFSHPLKAQNFITHPLTLFLALHLIWAYCCILSSTNSLHTLKFALSKSWHLIGCVIASYVVVRNIKNLWIILALLIFSTTLTIIIINTEHSFYGFTFDTIGRACHPLYRNHVIYGVFITMIFPFLFVIRTRTKKFSIYRLLIDITILLFIAGIFFSYTRGAWLALPIMLGVWFCITYKLFRFVYPIGVVAGVLFFLYLSKDYHFLKYAPDYEKTIYHEELSDHLSSTFDGEDLSTMERFHRWIAAFRLFKEHPIMGTGPSTFVDIYKPYTSPEFETYVSSNEERSTVHNYFIYILAEQGIIGFIIIVLVVGSFFIYGEHQYNKLQNPIYKKLYLACILCGSVFWLNNLFSDLLEANKVAPLWFFCLAWMVQIEEWDAQTKDSNPVGRKLFRQ